MQNGMAKVLESVFGKRELDAVSVEEIQALIAEFPSFNAGHYFLSRKLQATADPAFDAVTRKTALYFSNPLWLQDLLDTPPPGNTSGMAAASLIATDSPDGEGETASAAGGAPTLNEAFHAVDSAPSVNEEFHQQQAAVPTLNEVLEDQAEALRSTGAFQNDYPDYTPAGEQSAAEGYAATETTLDETFGGVHQQDSKVADFPDQPQSLPQPFLTNDPALHIPDAPDAPDPAPGEPAGYPAGAETGTSGTPAANRDPEHPLPAEPPEYAQANAGPVEKPLIDYARMTAKSAGRPPVPFDEKKATAIVFEPYHTIDYFASQGIKVLLDDRPSDPFGRQLKSFTEWLKTMKRLPVQALTGKADEHETEQVKHFAADSVEERDVVTETMAEVLLKQGMIENAILLYQKLSLIYPLKSAYFAARIEQIKASRK